MGNKNIPEVRFTGFTGAWKECKLGNMANFSKGNGYSKSDLTAEGKPVILYGRLYTKHETVIKSVDTFTIEKEKSVISKGNEVIVPSSGETSEDISRASVVNNPGIILGGDLNIIKPSNEINSVFLALTISNGKQQKELTKRAQGKSVVHLHNSDLKEVNLLYPEKDEQIKIGSFFEQLDDIIALHQQELTTLKQTKQGFLQKMFPKEGESVPEVRFPGFTGNWKQRKLKDLLESAYQGINTAGDKVEYSDSGVKVLQSKHITSGTISFDDARYLDKDRYSEYFPKYVPDVDDILFANIGTIGPSTVVTDSKEFLIAWNILKMTPSNEANSRFIQLQLQRLNSQRYFEKVTTGNATKFVNKDEMLGTQIVVPEKKEQSKIGDLFANLDHIITRQQCELDVLKETKKAFLQKMFV